jgi:acyl-coenzyme A synthetase/AMP-(fatty) acid ligase
MLAWWGEVLYEYWGGTEVGVTTFVDSREWLAHPGTVGRALPHFEVFAVDEAGHRLPPGSEGALFARHRRIPDAPLARLRGRPAAYSGRQALREKAPRPLLGWARAAHLTRRT